MLSACLPQDSQSFTCIAADRRARKPRAYYEQTCTSHLLPAGTWHHVATFSLATTTLACSATAASQPPSLSHTRPLDPPGLVTPLAQRQDSTLNRFNGSHFLPGSHLLESPTSCFDCSWGLSVFSRASRRTLLTLHGGCISTCLTTRLPPANACLPVSATGSDVLISTAPVKHVQTRSRNHCGQEPACFRMTARYHQDVDAQQYQLLGLAMCDCHWIRGLG